MLYGTLTQINQSLIRINQEGEDMPGAKVNKNKEIKTFNMRMPKDTWLFLKKTAIDQEISMTDIIVRCVQKYEKRFKEKLTSRDTYVE